MTARPRCNRQADCPVPAKSVGHFKDCATRQPASRLDPAGILPLPPEPPAQPWWKFWGKA